MIHKPNSQSPRQVVLTKVCREIGKLFPMQTENAVIQGSGFLGKTDIYFLRLVNCLLKIVIII